MADSNAKLYSDLDEWLNEQQGNVKEMEVYFYRDGREISDMEALEIVGSDNFWPLIDRATDNMIESLHIGVARYYWHEPDEYGDEECHSVKVEVIPL